MYNCLLDKEILKRQRTNKPQVTKLCDGIEQENLMNPKPSKTPRSLPLLLEINTGLPVKEKTYLIRERRYHCSSGLKIICISLGNLK
jgi:hypothetical protein